MVQAHIYYSGMVQGVGFRYVASRMASTLGLKGWVKNLTDGRVEAVVDGPKEKIEVFCQNMEQHFSGSISDCDMAYVEVKTTFNDFRITY